MKNYLLLLQFIFIAFSSCSKAEDIPIINNNELVGTVWKRLYIGNVGRGIMGYESLKFPSNDDVLRTW